MKEVFEKIKERLNTERGRYWNDNSEYGTGKWSGIDEAMDIVDQVAEEYQECALCYFGNPCEYQNKDARMPESELNNGWIPCSERLPKVYIPVLVTYRRNDGTRKVVVAKMEADCEWKIEFGGYCDSESVIAWQPLPEPYRGE